MALVIGVVVLGTASESKAVTNEELLEIIKQQGEQIERLNKRLDLFAEILRLIDRLRPAPLPP